MPVPDTYYTRPMPQPWSKPLAVDRLSREAAVLDFDIAVTQLPRVSSRVELLGGRVQGRVHFGRDAHRAVAEVTLEGEVQLRCQRCMRPMALSLSARTSVALLGSAHEADALSGAFEPVLAREGRISVAELVEEEVLLSLPIVPMHAEQPQCRPLEQTGPAEQQPAEAATQRPFAGLGKLLSQK